MCVHRERIAGEALPYGKANATDSFVATDHPLYGGSRIVQYRYDPSGAMGLLDNVGWRDEDGDGVREAHGVTGIRNGTPLSVTLLTNRDHLAHERVARILVENLSACGIHLTVEYLPADELFADGPHGPVFGGQFDLVLFSWLNDLDAPCWLYLTSEIPSAENWWATSNNPGYSSEAYDNACLSALAAFPGSASFRRYHVEAQRIFSRDLPVLPLYFVPKLVAIRPGVSGVTLDPTEHLELWAIEQFDIERPPQASD
jgi:peptide/nickel transport system substrate-binding protein